MICGDFNSLWKKYLADAFDRGILPANPLVSGVYQLLSQGSLPISHSHHPAQRGFRAFGGLHTQAAAQGGPSSSSMSGTPPQAAVAGSVLQPAAAAASGGAGAGGRAGAGQTCNPQQVVAVQAVSPAATAAASPFPPPQPTAAATATAAAVDNGHTQFSTHSLQLHSAYAAARGLEPPLTNKHPSFAGCLDYVWVSKGGLQVVGVLHMPYEQQQQAGGLRELPASAVPFQSIPDATWASDHLAVGAVLKFD